MSASPTSMGQRDGILDALDATTNATADAPANAGLGSLQDLGFMLLELKLLVGALGIIYLGAHASLRRPPSASPSKKKKKKKKKKASDRGDDHAGDVEDDDDDDDDDDGEPSQGLEATDAILFPLLAACILVGLYYLIQWLKNPDLLNRILRGYITTMSIASLVTFYGHGIQLATSLVFPRWWRARDGSLRRVAQRARAVVTCDQVGNAVGAPDANASPLPGPLAELARSRGAASAAWGLRAVLTQYSLDLWVHVLGSFGQRVKIDATHVMALLLSVATGLVYYSTTSHFLSNVLGYGMCYASFLLLSPTDFFTGSLVLMALFVYDIIMVFYTPYMITVATKLDVPIKLTFEAASRKSMLGLGDIVIPGMVIAWALRLDLWIHYLRKVKKEPTELTVIEKNETSGTTVSRVESKDKEVKANYVSVKGKWGDALWARGALFLSRPAQLPPDLEAAAFPKPYFYAAMTGYTLGMMCTLAMLLVFKQGQPALLYLVPGVLISLAVTALARGEVGKLWRYTEDGSLDTKDVVVEVDGDGEAVKALEKLKTTVVDPTKVKTGAKDEVSAAVGKKRAPGPWYSRLITVCPYKDRPRVDAKIKGELEKDVKTGIKAAVDGEKGVRVEDKSA